jgi:hypothetical protein
MVISGANFLAGFSCSSKEQHLPESPSIAQYRSGPLRAPAEMWRATNYADSREIEIVEVRVWALAATFESRS